MSWSRRSLLLIPLALAACGFAPTLAPGSAATGLQGRIRVADPTDKNGFDFLQRMDERLGRASDAAYDLAYVITTKSSGVGITPEGTIQRYNLTGSIDWTLTSRADGARITGGRVGSFTSYSATGSTVAGLAAEEDAALRLMRILADQIVLRLQSTAAAWAS
jgi:LPS-assembly lipoprotein